jgi:hypothetical protein
MKTLCINNEIKQIEFLGWGLLRKPQHVVSSSPVSCYCTTFLNLIIYQTTQHHISKQLKRR